MSADSSRTASGRPTSTHERRPLCISGWVKYYAGAIYPEWQIGHSTKKGDCP